VVSTQEYGWYGWGGYLLYAFLPNVGANDPLVLAVTACLGINVNWAIQSVLPDHLRGRSGIAACRSSVSIGPWTMLVLGSHQSKRNAGGCQTQHPRRPCLRLVDREPRICRSSAGVAVRPWLDSPQQTP
jgi:hypothetical protein